MKVKEFNEGREERLVLAGAAGDDLVAAKLCEAFTHGNPFPSKCGNIIGGLIRDYFREHGKAPGRRVLQSLLEGWADKNQNHPQVDELPSLWENILQDRKIIGKVQTEYLLKVQAELFSKTWLDRALTKARGHLDAGRLTDARLALNDLTETSQGSPWTFFLGDEKEVESMFRRAQNPIAELYQGELGKLLNPFFTRNSFLAFEGREGVGKSYWLMDLAVRAMQYGGDSPLRVAYFQAGDMSREDVEFRFCERFAERPRGPDSYNYPKEGKPPDTIKTIQRTCDDYLDKPRVLKAMTRFRKKFLKSEKHYLAINAYSNHSISAEGIWSELRGLERRGFPSDIVVIDYADVLAPINPREDKLEKVNTTWSRLRRISQDMNNIVVTATQLKREAYEARVIRMKDTADDKRKLAHVTGMFGLTQTEEDKRNGVYGINVVKSRSVKHSSRVVFTAACLAEGKVAVQSAKEKREVDHQ